MTTPSPETEEESQLLDKYLLPDEQYNRSMVLQRLRFIGEDEWKAERTTHNDSITKERARRALIDNPTATKWVKFQLKNKLLPAMKSLGADLSNVPKDTLLGYGDAAKGRESRIRNQRAATTLRAVESGTGVYTQGTGALDRPGVHYQERKLIDCPIVIVNKGTTLRPTGMMQGMVGTSSVDYLDVTATDVSVVQVSSENLRQWFSDNAEVYIVKASLFDELGHVEHYYSVEETPTIEIGLNLTKTQALLMDEDQFEVIDPMHQVLTLAGSASKIVAGGVSSIGSPNELVEMVRSTIEKAELAKDIAEFSGLAERLQDAFSADSSSKKALDHLYELRFSKTGAQNIPCTAAVTLADGTAAMGFRIGDVLQEIEGLIG